MKHPFDERNQQDYLALSERLIAGLKRISEERNESGDYKYAASSAVLARVAECSVATLYARQKSTDLDPILSLKAIKSESLEEQRRTHRSQKKRIQITKQHLMDVSEHIEINNKLREETRLALDEVSRWNYLYLDAKMKCRELKATNTRLVEKITILETKNACLSEKIKFQQDSELSINKIRSIVTTFVKKD
jgi:hypothetical protein